MAVIQQGNSYKAVIGWYGTCGESECQDLELSVFKNQSTITAVFQWDTNGVLKVWKENLPDALNRQFNKLECGKMYYIYVRPGQGSFTIPNFVVSSYETVDAGRVTSSCVAPVDEPTPTPEKTPTPTPEKTPTPTPEPVTDIECCSSSTTTYTTDGNLGVDVEVGYVFQGNSKSITVLKYNGWQSGGKLCVDMTNLDSVSENQNEVPRFYSLPSDPETAIGSITRQYNNLKNTFYYTDTNNVCYMGEYTDDGQDWQSPVVLTNVGETNTDDDDPTPTPKQTPTPTPEKPNQLEFRWSTIDVQGVGEREVLQVKNILKPTNSNFASRNTSENWSTVYGYTGNDGAYSLSNAFWPDAAVASNYNDHYSSINYDGLQFALGSNETDGTIGNYKQLSVTLSDTTEFSHDSSESSPSYLFIYKEDNSDSDSSAKGASDVWPVIVKKLEPTPTPKQNTDNDETPTPVDCTCIPDGLSVAELPTGIMDSVGGYTFAEFEKGAKIAWDESSLKNGFAIIYMSLPNGDSGGTIVFSGKDPDDTVLYYMTESKCYTATIGEDQKESDGYFGTWTLVNELSEKCKDASFEEEVTCCTDYESKVYVILGNSTESVNGVQNIKTHDDGKMDGTLCFTADPLPDDFVPAPGPAYIVSLEGQPSDMAFALHLSRDSAGIKFIYRLKNGQCYEGYIGDDEDVTFTEIV